MNFYRENIQIIMNRWPNQVLDIERAQAIKTKCANKNNIDLLGDVGAEGVILILGFGNGAMAREILRKSRHHIVIVYERDLSKLKWALQTKSLAKLLASTQFLLLSGPVMDLSWLNAFHWIMTNSKFWIIRDKLATKGYSEFYDEIQRKVKTEKQFADINVGTQISLGKKFANAILENVPSIVKAQGIISLQNRFRGMPAIIVSSGPSLDGEIQGLRRAKGKSVILCVDTALPTLLKHGIFPDFVTGIDPLPDNKALFKMKGARDLPFICMSQYTPDVLKLHKGPLFVSAQQGNVFYNWLQWFWSDKGNLESFGGSVSHFATNVAEWMGCNPIGLLGQDLCFTSKYHAGGVTKLLHDGMGLEEPDETIGAIKTKNCKGKKVFTKATLISFKTAFENKIASCPGISIVNLTSNGLKIEGATIMPLKRFLSLYGKPVTISMPQNGSCEVDLPGLIERLDLGMKIFKGIVKVNHRILKLIHKTMDARKINDRPAIHKYVKKIETLYPLTKHPILSLLSSYHFHLELYLKKKQIREIDQIKGKKWVKLDRQLDRGLNFYAEIIEAADLLMKELRILKRRLTNNAKEENENARSETA